MEAPAAVVAASGDDDDDDPAPGPSHGNEEEDDDGSGKMCRVCRGDDGDLYYPCLCTGSIKYVHQECLLEWLRHSKRDVCELCHHKYSFQPIYRPDMPRQLPVLEIAKGVARRFLTATRQWLLYTLVLVSWAGLVPVVVARIYSCVFSGSFSQLLLLPISIFSVENLVADGARGCVLLALFIAVFVSLVWLREQIAHAGPAHLLYLDQNQVAAATAAARRRRRRGAGAGNQNLPAGQEERQNIVEDQPQGQGQQPAEAVGEPPEPEGNLVRGEEEEEEEDAHSEYTINSGSEDDDDDAENSDDDEEEDSDREQGFDAPLADPLRGAGRNRAVAAAAAEVHRHHDGNHDNENEDNLNANLPAEQNREQPAAEEPQQPAEAADAAPVQPENQDDRDWGERLGDELTWQRLLGLDGSLIFLEHVLWVIALHTVFTILFAYSPFTIGQWLLSRLGLASHVRLFPSLAMVSVSIFCGYVTLWGIVSAAHHAVRLLRWGRTYRCLGISFLVLKVFLLVFVEIGLFPIFCGCWLDLCSLPLFNATLSARLAALHAAPSSSLFLHWMIGMLFVFYAASVVLLLREVLRPGVLWFMRNLNDPDFNPIQEMIEQPVSRHARRLVASCALFSSSILLLVWVPLRVIAWAAPGFLPYNMSVSSEAPLTELSLELLLLQVVLPTLLEQAHARHFAKLIVRTWCQFVGGFLGLEYYLLPAAEDPAQNPAPLPPLQPDEGGGGGLAAQHRALLADREQPPIPAEDRSRRPRLFALRLVLLLVALGASSVLAATTFYVVPVWLGRRFLTRVDAALGGNGFADDGSGGAGAGTATIQNGTGNNSTAAKGAGNMGLAGATSHEIYTMGAGLYACWLALRIGQTALEWAPLGWRPLVRRAAAWSLVTARVAAVGAALIGALPWLFGLSFQLTVLNPMRVALAQTPLYVHAHNWAMGVLHVKIVCAAVVMGPEWWLKRELDQLYDGGVRAVRVRRVLRNLFLPVALSVGVQLAAPFLGAEMVAWLLGLDEDLRLLLVRHAHLATVLCALGVLFVRWQYERLVDLVQGIRNEKYLVGTRLVNYEKNRREESEAEEKNEKQQQQQHGLLMLQPVEE